MALPPEDLRAAVAGLLPNFVPGRTTHAMWRRDHMHEDGYTIEELQLFGETGIPATLVRPAGNGPYPAVLYCHAHGGDYKLGRRELLDASSYLHEPGYGPALAAMGFASLCIDMPGFGGRQNEGTESAMTKSLGWCGKSLFGRMLDDLSMALGYLGDRPDVDARRIFTVGLSMGAAHAYWLAALDPRVAGCAHLCMLADILPMISSGAHDGHGHYLTVPGLLNVAETGDVAGLIAPRSQLVCHGGQDHLTPEAARVPALGRLVAAYDRVGAPDALTIVLDPEAGHRESAPMRVAVLDFLARNSAPTRPNFEG